MNTSSNDSSAIIRILIVDDHKMVRVGLRELLSDARDIVVAGEAACASEALAAVERFAPDVLLLDFRLPDRDGAYVCAKVKTMKPHIRVLMLTSFKDERIVSAALAGGADGYVLKEIDGPDLAEAIRKVHRGDAFLDPAVARQVIEKVRSHPDPFSVLSIQERRILSLVAEGKTNKEIAGEMALAEKTVRNYLSAAMSKLHVSRRSEAVALFVRATG